MKDRFIKLGQGMKAGVNVCKIWVASGNIKKMIILGNICAFKIIPFYIVCQGACTHENKCTAFMLTGYIWSIFYDISLDARPVVLAWIVVNSVTSPFEWPGWRGKMQKERGISRLKQLAQTYYEKFEELLGVVCHWTHGGVDRQGHTTPNNS